MVAYHSTRLSADEEAAIRCQGLRPLMAEERRARLVRTLECHPDWPVLSERLDAVMEDLGGGLGAGQRVGHARQSSKPARLHPDYFKSSILGSWDLHLPLLQALCIEIWLINQMTTAMCGKLLFRTDYGEYGEYGENRPKKLALLIRPTLEEFNTSVHLLDKVLSENISKDFFKGVLALETEAPRADGKVVVTPKGTLALLDEYLRSVYRTSDWSPWTAAMSALRKVRKHRQQPAHALQEDVFDPKYARDFKDLCVDAYGALATLQNCLQRHPSVIKANLTVPQDLEDGRIWTL